MMDFAYKFCKAEELGLDTFTRTLATAKARSKLSEHRRSVVCEKAFAGCLDVLALMAEVCTKYVVSLDYDTTVSKEVFETSEVFGKTLAARASIRTVDS